jgi:hypothetical protein
LWSELNWQQPFVQETQAVSGRGPSLTLPACVCKEGPPRPLPACADYGVARIGIVVAWRPGGQRIVLALDDARKRKSTERSGTMPANEIDRELAPGTFTEQSAALKSLVRSSRRRGLKPTNELPPRSCRGRPTALPAATSQNGSVPSPLPKGDCWIREGANAGIDRPDSLYFVISDAPTRPDGDKKWRLLNLPKCRSGLNQFLGCSALILASLSSLASTLMVSVAGLAFGSSPGIVRVVLAQSIRSDEGAECNPVWKAMQIKTPDQHTS